MRYQLEYPFKSLSGTIRRKRLADGTLVSWVARKDGTMYILRTAPRKKKEECD